MCSCYKCAFQDVAVLDSQQLAFDCIVATVFDGFSEFAGGSSDVHFSLRGIFEGMWYHILYPSSVSLF